MIDKAVEEILKKHLEKRYVPRRGAVILMTPANNLLGQSIFREVRFADGSYVTFCVRADGKSWFRHSGGGRYGARSRYEGKLSQGEQSA